MSNLPPGVSSSDIPGNRPEDEAEEAFWQAFSDKLEKAGILEIGIPLNACLRIPPRVEIDDLWDQTDFVQMIQIARDMGFERGSAEGRAEADMDKAYHDENAALAAEMQNMADAHAEGQHIDHPREFCPECQASRRV